MDKIKWVISNKILPNLTIIIVFLISLTTLSVTAYKLSQTIPIPDATESTDGEIDTTTDNGLVAMDDISEIIDVEQVILNSQNKCIVYIAGKKYNLYPLASTHSGPKGFSFFICNSDMTAVYQSQHGKDYSRIAPYLYTGTEPLPSIQIINTVPTSIVPTPPSNLCLVTVAGQLYNLYPLASTHSGPRGFTFFICNSDMTAIYQSQHGTNYSRIQPYLYTGPTPTGINPTLVLTPTPKVGPCLITINGRIYDMNREGFTSKHKGGDIFVCNTDQTALFNSQHGTNYDMLHDYDILNSGDDD
jgi:cytochrome b involved in lipid metabolism